MAHLKYFKESFKFHIRRSWLRIAAPLTGLAAFIWFLIRVIPKPSRAAYPCQRVAAPLASSFAIWLLGLSASALGIHRARRLMRASRYAVAGLCAVAAVAALLVPVGMTSNSADAFSPTEPRNQPMGVARGIHPGRVVWVHEPAATDWDGRTGVWWDDEHTKPDVVDNMMAHAILQVAGETHSGAAWNAIFRDFNRTHGNGDVGYQQGEKIAIKINWINSAKYRWDNPRSGSKNPSPQMLHALLWQLVVQAGVEPSDITVYDAIRYAGDPLFDRCTAAFPGVRFADNIGQKGRLKVQPDPNVTIHYGDPSLEDNAQVHFPDFVVEAKYLINMALAKPHNALAGVTLCAKNFFGSIWRPSWVRFEGWDPSNMHCSVAAFNFYEGEPLNQRCDQVPMGSYNALVDLLGHEHLGGKTLLYLMECMWYKYWGGEPFNGDWASSLFASQDGVAIDSVVLDFLRSEGDVKAGTVDNYLHEAALAHDPPSGIAYDPEGNGSQLQSLGVHEHWNNSLKKEYSRNLGTGDGIELVSVGPGLATVVLEEHDTAQPEDFALEQNFPNPFNSATVIRFSLPRDEDVELSLYNLQGQKVTTLIAGVRQTGVHTVRWDGREESGQELTSGLYLYSLRTGTRVETRKLMLVR